MNRHTAIALAFFALVIVGLISYQRITLQAPPAELPRSVTDHGDGQYGAAGFAVVDTVGLVQAPNGMYYDMAGSLDAEVKAFIRANDLYLADFRPAIETDWQDSLGRAPVIAGTWIYLRE